MTSEPIFSYSSIAGAAIATQVIPIAGYDIVECNLFVGGAANIPIVSYHDANNNGTWPVYNPSAGFVNQAVYICFGVPFNNLVGIVGISPTVNAYVGIPIVPMVVQISMQAVALSTLVISVTGYYNEVLPNTH